MNLDHNNVFPASDWFDINFFGGFASSPSKIKEQLNEQKYKIDDERLSSRLLNHWYKTGIIDDDRPNGKGWKKFSISELVWVQIVFKLRKFGLDLNRIKLVKNQIDVYNKLDESSNCLLLDFYIAVAIHSSIPIKLIVFESGQADIVRQVDIDIANQIQMIPEDFIMIDLNKLLNNLFTKKDIKVDYFNYSLTQVEKEVRKALYIDQVKSLHINIGGGKWMVLNKEHIKYNLDDINKLIKNIGDHYELATIVKGHTRNYKIIEKIKIKK